MDQLIDGRHKTSKFESEDVITNMPNIVITNILDRLSLRDALRTSVWSRNWRFKWTMLSQLVIDESFLNSCKPGNQISHVISKIIFHIRGAITKFVISLDYEYLPEVVNDEDIGHWIFFLSRKGITDLTLKFSDETTFELPTHLFSCLELKHLNLHNCDFDSAPPTTFHGFPNLLSLELQVGFNENCVPVKLFSKSPLLEILKVADTYFDCKVELVEIAKLKNLKILSLRLCDIADTNLFEHVGSLPKLQELHLDFRLVKLTEDVAKIRCSTGAFPCLKAIKLATINLDFGMGLSYIFELLRSFPTLHTLEIRATRFMSAGESAPSPKVDHNTMGMLQLQKVVFKDLNASENEVNLIKCLLACSSFLKKIVIHPREFLSSDQRLMFTTKLSNLHRASPVAKINLF